MNKMLFKQVCTTPFLSDLKNIHIHPKDENEIDSCIRCIDRWNQRTLLWKVLIHWSKSVC